MPGTNGTNDSGYVCGDPESIAKQLGGHLAVRVGEWWNTLCPCHKQDTISLGLKTNGDGKLIAHCFADCDWEEVLDELVDHGLAERRENGDASDSKTNKKDGADSQNKWQLIVPVPKEMRDSQFRDSKKHGKYVRRFPYHDEQGRLIAYAVRYERDTKKSVLQRTVRYNPHIAKPVWTNISLPEPRPLYNQHRLVQRPNDPVDLFEGEKSCDAGQAIFGKEHVCVTWSHGTSNIAKVDWTLLMGRDVTFWRDNYSPGYDAMRKIAQRLAKGGGTLRWVNIPEGFPDGWDIADPMPEGYDAWKLYKKAGEVPAYSQKLETYLTGIDPEKASFVTQILIPRYSGTLNAENVSNRFVEIIGPQIRFNATTGRWLWWNGNYWEIDETEFIKDAVRRFTSKIADDNPKAKVGGADFISSIERLARIDQRVATVSKDWDLNPDLLGTPAGVIDLRTGQFKMPPDPSDMISMITQVAPIFEPCPKWLAFLDQTTGGVKARKAGDEQGVKASQEYFDFLQRLFGYGITGHIAEEIFAFLYGLGGNGKGTTLKVIKRILGPYAYAAPSSVFIKQPYGEGHPAALAALDGPRLVIVQEVPENAHWNEERLKAATGGDELAGRFMRENWYNFIPRFLLVFAANDKPMFDNVGPSIERRFRLLPMNNRPPFDDTKLKERLYDEEGGQILGWLIEGAAKWYKEGCLKFPKSVEIASRTYLQEQDTVVDWFKENCILDSKEAILLKHCFANYTGFMFRSKDERKVLGRNKFSARLKEYLAEEFKGRVTQDEDKSDNIRFKGIRFRESEEVPF